MKRFNPYGYPTPPAKRTRAANYNGRMGLAAAAAKLYGLATAAKVGFKTGQAIRKVFSGAGRSAPDYATAVVKAGRASGSAAPRRKRYRTQGRYVGRFKRPRRLSRKDDGALNSGFVNTSEITGTVSDVNCVYVGHSVMSGNEVIENIVYSLLRKLYKKGLQFNVTNIQEPLPSLGTGGYTIRLTRELMDGTNTIQNFDYVPSATDTIQLIVGNLLSGIAPAGAFSVIMDVFKDYAAGNTASVVNLYQPVKLQLLESANFNVLARINLKEEVFHMTVSSQLKVQNRTLAADSGADATDVSNNPLMGKLYRLGTGCPITAVDYTPLISSVPDFTGAITVASSSFTKTGFYEPPHPKMFTNCTGSSTVRLEPGAIKVDKLYYSKSQNLLKFLTSFGYGIGPAGAVATLNRQMKLKGKCTLLALEDVINVNAAQSISVAYEINRKIGVYCTTMKPAVSMGFLAQATQSA